MKQLIFKLFSIRILSALGLLFAICISLATFLEYNKGTDVAWYYIYDALWFELLLAYLGLGSLVNVFRSKLFQKGKLGIMLFHFSISIIILGAGITRYGGETGTLNIREGDSSGEILLNDMELRVIVESGGDTIFLETKIVNPNIYTPNYYSQVISDNDNEIRIESVAYAKTPKGIPYTKFAVSHNNSNQNVIIYHSAYVKASTLNFNAVNVSLSIGNKVSVLPFTVQLDSFIIERYPGSTSPSSFTSYVKVDDPRSNTNFSFDIYMNNILNYDGYRFFQASYDDDEKGTILSVNHDPWGTLVSYFGYFLLVLGMLKALSDKKSRFVKHVAHARNPRIGALFLLLFIFPIGSFATTNKQNAKMFGELWVQTNDGRIKPMNTFSVDLLRKLSKQSEEKNRMADEVILDILKNQEKAANLPLLYKKMLGIPSLDELSSKRISYNDLFDSDGNYILEKYVAHIHKKKADDRTKLENNVLALDERANIFNMLRNGVLLKLFPLPGDASAQWMDIRSTSTLLKNSDSTLQKAFTNFYINFFSSNSTNFSKSIEFVHNWQSQFGSSYLPSKFSKDIELKYNQLNIFERLSRFYGLISLTMLVAAIVTLINRNKRAAWLARVMGIHLSVAAFIHGVGLVLRGYISGYMPLSNGYETMIFVAWIALLIGIYFRKKSYLTFALMGLLASSALMVAHLSFMNPQITPLVPVLKSVWLNIHVTVITSSYAFLGGCFILALAILLFMAFLNEKNAKRISPIIRQLISINRMVMIPGLYLLTIGCFLGAIWANQSWGKYWGWDPKETWCLVSVVVYSFVAHLNHLPGLKGSYYYVLGTLLAFGTILMTYFGVNYFLGGMHSYAGTANLTFMPLWIIVALIILFGLVVVAYFRYQKITNLEKC